MCITHTHTRTHARTHTHTLSLSHTHTHAPPRTRTPQARVERLQTLPSVDRVISLEGVGHCPHDEAPEMVNPILVDFLKVVAARESA